jgi:hypothetical protein
MDNLIRKIVRSAYDIQELRIATGLRVVAQFRDRFASDESAPEEDKEAEDKKKEKLLKLIRASYDRVTDGIADNARAKKYKFDNILMSPSEVYFVEQYLRLLDEEGEAFKRLEKSLKEEPFYNEYLSKIRGIGPAMAGVIISELDPYRAKYPSSFWKYAGLDVVPVFNKEAPYDLIKTEGRGRREHHLVQQTYQDKDGKQQTKRGISYNPWLKSKLLAVLASSFLRAGNDQYVPIYQNYKMRQMNRPELQGNPAIKAISHKRAVRYMIKMFLQDLHIAWRAFENLEVSVPYAEAKLGLKHGVDPSAQA